MLIYSKKCRKRIFEKISWEKKVPNKNNSYLFIENEENSPKNDEDDIIYQEQINLLIYAFIIKSININPEGPNCEMYKGRILINCNVDKFYDNGDNKTVKEAVSHYRIDIAAINNFIDAKKELTKEKNVNCPYYA